MAFRLFVLLANNRIDQRQNEHRDASEQKDAEIAKKSNHRLTYLFLSQPIFVSASKHQASMNHALDSLI